MCSHDHGTAEVNEELEPPLVCKQCVPDTDDLGEKELLGEEEGQPAEPKEGGVDPHSNLWRNTSHIILYHFNASAAVYT